MPYCTDCGYKIENTDKFCYKCGKPVIKEFSSLFVKPIINPSNSLKDVLKQSEVTQTQKSSTSQEKINSIESESEPTILSLPYSCVSNNVEVTLLGLALVEGYERGILLDNKKQYEVVIKFRNLFI